MQETARLLADLVALPSLNPMGRTVSGDQWYEYQVTNYLEQFFRRLDVPFQRQAVAPKRENIVARFQAPGTARTLLLEVHQDTVPVDNMTIDPFGSRIEGGRLFGRGACDVKGGMAAMLAAFARLARNRPAGAMNVLLACTVDEEHTFLGIQKLVEAGPRADLAIVAEPTQLDIVRAHKGAIRWKMATVGRACHSSRPDQGLNAIYRMGHLLTGIERYAAHLHSLPPDPLLGPPTLSVGRIEGGTSVNTVPDRCTIELDRRVIPGEDPSEAPTQLMNFLHAEGGIHFPVENEEPWMRLPPLGPELSVELVDRLGAAIQAVRGSWRALAVPYGTDASTLAAAGIPSVIFGPGDIAQAHTRDEWIDLAEVELASEILYRFACRS
jgi:acetylornithine deacetylase